MPKKLDRSRGFGEVYGHEAGACYEQDGVLFDANELEIAASLAPAPKRSRKSAEVISTEDQLQAQLGEQSGLES